MATPISAISLIKPSLPSLLSSSFSGTSLSCPTSIPSPAPCFPGRLRIEAAKKIQGKVVCATNDKTVAVEVTRIFADPKYKKRVKTSKKYHAHDPENACKVGDVVTLAKCAPVSKTKKFKVLDIKSGRLPASPKKIAEEIVSPFESTIAA
ncbi:hypothetical protein O6H91_11G107900 [Diphasiastrum complanatum]|uniref:Uncharacterized protein n=4 Tax=Diphasiastrum complanatum TaxID=34168 RepID=A0ACC2CCM4_DIPCM|nr:hypothetical protein O6H91_11G107900 [Diphasiastrum complanatum]KAJ7539765.1 hypothetical protein O6H91_11G107900 [Diphasiastrum complanatum]KAJ7539766.1 hypothetical protein O6H91_11G107900 [Diphasiastrum complanatum]KAJ7539767.1 hypothetical protein O6H91_11G107900 [Diphasiastrum complanatum]